MEGYIAGSIVLQFGMRVVTSGFPIPHRVDLKDWEERDISIVTWTVNKMEEKEYFQEALRLPFMTDSCSPEEVAPEQSH